MNSSASDIPAGGVILARLSSTNLRAPVLLSGRMKSAGKFSIVLVTAPDLKTARLLAKAALSARLVACLNLVPKIESHFRWHGKITSDTEVLLVLKTVKSKLAALEKLILARHLYDTPEFLVLPVTAGNQTYLDWLASAIK